MLVTPSLSSLARSCRPSVSRSVPRANPKHGHVASLSSLPKNTVISKACLTMMTRAMDVVDFFFFEKIGEEALLASKQNQCWSLSKNIHHANVRRVD